jgi:hypothetical protein
VERRRGEDLLPSQETVKKLLSKLKKRIYGGNGNGGGNVGIVTSNKKYLTMCLLMYYDWKPLKCIVFVIAGMRNIERTLCRKWLK